MDTQDTNTQATSNAAAAASNAQGGGQQLERTFTQAELNVILADRLNRQKAQYADYDTLKEQAAKWAAAQEAEKTEAQRLAEAAATARRERDEALQRAQDRLIRAAFIAEAAKAGAAHPEDVYALADIAKVSLDEQDNPVGVAEAVAEVIAAGRVPLVQSQAPRAPDLDAGAGSGQRASDQKRLALTDEELAIARKLRINPEAYLKRKQEMQGR